MSVTAICRTAIDVDAGKARSSKTGDSWHGRCPGSVIDARGTVHVCDCDCHGAGRCAYCGIGAEQTEQAKGRCTDQNACGDRIQEALDANPTYRLIQDSKQASLEEGRQARAANGGGGTCAHCGTATGGGQFAPGHDAKLKGMLLRAARDNDIDAVAEMEARGWWKGAETHKVDPAVEDAALHTLLAPMSDTQLASWLGSRVDARIEAAAAAEEQDA